MTIRRTWKIAGSGADLRLVEHARSNEETAVTYQQAKSQAVNQLESVIAQYQHRLREIENDTFRDRGRLPSFKAWVGRTALVVAKSQKRAAELLRISVYDLRKYYGRPEGDWWYEFSREESIWFKADETSHYVRALSNEDALNLVREELVRYESMGASRLTTLVGTVRTFERTCSRGSLVKLRITISRFDSEPEWIWVESEISERVARRVGEVIRLPARPKAVCNWKTEGF